MAPIIIFAFNRVDSLKNTIQSLMQNTEVIDSDLFIFVDGARDNKPDEIIEVKKVQEYVMKIDGFKSVHYYFSSINQGLGNSIIKGVSQIINKYKKAIILEDDLIFSKNFLSYMNQGLDIYENKKEVFSICGYTNKIEIPHDYNKDAYFCVRSSSWGWATWVDRWNSVDWELKDWNSVIGNKKKFNSWGGSDCFSMLREWKKGKNQSWAIRFSYSQFTQKKVSLFPIISKVKNDGFDGSGTNCKKWSRFKYDFDASNNKTFLFPISTVINNKLYQSAMQYNSLLIRIWSRLMYIIH